MHDMGKALDDNYTEGSAETFEWRTTPLWGLGLVKNSQGGKDYLMYDGRVKSIEEAQVLPATLSNVGMGFMVKNILNNGF